MIVKFLEFKNINTKEVKEFLDSHPETQLFSARCFHGKKHVLHCVNECLKTFASGNNIAKSMQVEFLLILTGTRQIRKAMKKAAASKRSIFVAWGGKDKKGYSDLRKKFIFTVKKLPKTKKEEEMKAMENSSMLALHN